VALAFGPYNAIWQQLPLCWLLAGGSQSMRRRFAIGDDFDKAEEVLFGIPLCTAGFTFPACRVPLSLYLGPRLVNVVSLAYKILTANHVLIMQWTLHRTTSWCQNIYI
jgi:hypothetical protein